MALQDIPMALHCLLFVQAIASGSAKRLPRAIADVSDAPLDIKARLRNVFVYTVTNNKNEFVLLSGEVSCLQDLPSSCRALRPARCG